MVKCAMLAAMFVSAASSQDISRDLPYVSIDIRTPPVAPQTAGGYLLEYELFVTNWYDKEITIRAVDTMAGNELLGTLEGEVLDRLFPVGSGQTAILGPRQTTTMVLVGVANELPERSTTGSVSVFQAISRTRSSGIERRPSAKVFSGYARRSEVTLGSCWMGLEATTTIRQASFNLRGGCLFRNASRSTS
jgi:hypothetical protein